MADDTVPVDGEDFDEAYAEGDPTLDDIDLDELVALDDTINHIQATTVEGTDERNLANLALLTELHGDDLRVL